MKKLFLFLLLANAALFAYGYYRHVSATSSADAERFRPLNPESVKVLSAQQVAKLGPAKVAQLTLACAEWGPLNEPELRDNYSNRSVWGVRLPLAALMSTPNIGSTSHPKRTRALPSEHSPNSDDSMSPMLQS
jgi:hypothetical protein